MRFWSSACAVGIPGGVHGVQTTSIDQHPPWRIKRVVENLVTPPELILPECLVRISSFSMSSSTISHNQRHFTHLHDSKAKGVCVCVSPPMLCMSDRAPHVPHFDMFASHEHFHGHLHCTVRKVPQIYVSQISGPHLLAIWQLDLVLPIGGSVWLACRAEVQVAVFGNYPLATCWVLQGAWPNKNGSKFESRMSKHQRLSGSGFTVIPSDWNQVSVYALSGSSSNPSEEVDPAELWVEDAGHSEEEEEDEDQSHLQSPATA